MTKVRNNMSSNDRDKALDMALAQIDKQFGKGAIMKMGERTNMAIETISTGALSLDLALGVGGLPRGRVVEIYGPESSGKSTLAMHVVAEAQRNGGVCAYIDAEHAMDPVYARAIGVDVDQLLISQPDTGEQALEIADMLTRSGAIDVLVIDSVAALTPRAEIVGNRTRVKVVKNKVSPPFRQAEFDIMYGQGISREGCLIDMSVDLGVVKKSGAWFTYEGEQLGQGREKAKEYLRQNPEVMMEISDKVLTAAGLKKFDDEPSTRTVSDSRSPARAVSARPFTTAGTISCTPTAEATCCEVCR